MSGHNEAGHAVGHAGSGCQEGDTHDDVRNPQRVTDDRDLEGAGRGEELRADTRPTCPWSLCLRVQNTSRAASWLGCRSGPGCSDGARVLQPEAGHSYFSFLVREAA